MKIKVWKWIVLVSAAAVLSVVGYAGYTIVHYMRTSPRFAVQTVSVVGLNRVEQKHVLGQAGMEAAANVFSVDLEEVRQRVEGLKWVRFATVQRLLPDTIAIKHDNDQARQVEQDKDGNAVAVADEIFSCLV